jgi:hypothetical protein
MKLTANARKAIPTSGLIHSDDSQIGRGCCTSRQNSGATLQYRL